MTRFDGRHGGAPNFGKTVFVVPLVQVVEGGWGCRRGWWGNVAVHFIGILNVGVVVVVVAGLLGGRFDSSDIVRSGDAFLRGFDGGQTGC